MICPKCGYEQEERIDCIKCGVVFSKYFALYPKGKVTRAEAAEPAHAPTVSQRTAEQPEPHEPLQLGQRIKELYRRFTEFELERAEQTRLRGEVSQLEQRMLGSLEELERRLIDLQRRVEEPPPLSLASEELSALRNEIRHEMAAIRESVASLDLNSVVNRIDQIESRIEGTQPKEGAGNLLELGSVLKELDMLRNSLQNVTVRYSEIGDLKKNHLTLSHSLETIQQELAKGREGASKEATQKIAGLEKEVLALRAESRQLLKQIEDPALSESARPEEIQGLKSELHALAESRSSQEQKLKELEAQLDALDADQAGQTDPNVLGKIQEMETRFTEIESKIPPPTAMGGKSRTADPLLELGNVLREVDGLRSSLQNVTVRYSEIGDLKKNYLILSNSLEALERDLAALKESEAGDVPRKLHDLEGERTALREEVRNLAKQVEASEGSVSAKIGELEARDADNRIDPKVLVKIQEMDGRFAEVEEKLSALSHEHGKSSTEVMEELGKVLKEVDGFRASLQNVSVRYSEIADLKKNHHAITEKLDALEEKVSTLAAQPSAEALPPLEADVHAIRENLEDIRRFMSTLSQKL